MPGDFGVKDKDLEKVTKYQDLVIEIQNMWDTNAKAIPIVFGALGAENQLTGYLTRLGAKARKSGSMQKTTPLGSAHILRKVLSTPAEWF